jgi:hypothetical protein
MMVVTNSHLFGNETVSKHDQNLEFNTDNSTSTSTGLKVEMVVISSSVASDSGDNHFSNIHHLNKIYSKKKCSLISHTNFLISKTLHLSPLITKLQI